METINPEEIRTQSQLVKCLHKIGYKAKIAPFRNIIILRDISKKFENEPCAWLIAKENDLEMDCVVSVENNAVYVYYYDEYNDLFRIWNKFTSNVNTDDLIHTIELATNKEKVIKKYMGNV